MAENIHDLVQGILGAAVELQDRASAIADLDAWPSSTGEPAVMGGGTSSPTEARATAWAEHGHDTRATDEILDALRRAHRILNAAISETDSTRPSAPCRCCGDVLATHGARCWDCHCFWRRNRYGCGDAIHEDRRKRRRTDCECGPDCCPDGCLDTVPPGEGRYSSRCRSRRARAAKAHASA